MDQRRDLPLVDVTGPLGAAQVIEVRVDDLAFFEGEAIVRPVNAMLGATTPIMRRLERSAGEAFSDQTRVAEPLPVGAAVVTRAGNLGVELVIHGVVSSDDETVSTRSVRQAMTSALQRVDAFQIRELAVAPFGLGAGNLDIEDSAEIMVTVLREHMRRSEYPATVIIVVETELEQQAVLNVLKTSE